MRKELKYEITHREYKSIVQVLDIVIKKDIHSNTEGEYSIKSIYFDNHLHEVENSKLNNINSLKKYRIRMYNNDDTNIFLERKTNENGFMQKIKQKIDKIDVIHILKGNYKEISGWKKKIHTGIA